jgi:hypothetical protein
MAAENKKKKKTETVDSLREFFAPVLEAYENRFFPKKKPGEGP